MKKNPFQTVSSHTSSLPDLDEVVISALDLFANEKLPKLNINYKRPLVVGSGNAAVTGKIIFNELDAIFADESTYSDKLEKIKNIDGVIIISASGAKHAPIIAKEVKKRKLNCILISNNDEAPAKDFVNKTFVFPKNEEPYTYNTSTYMGIILGKTNEKPKKIKEFIEEEINNRLPNNLGNYNAFYLIVPNKFDNSRELFMTKFDELFGAKVSGRVFTIEQTKHAKTVIPSNDELFISFGVENNLFGLDKIFIPLPSWADYATMMAVAYYVIGKIQKAHPPYFKENIENYLKELPKIFG